MSLSALKGRLSASRDASRKAVTFSHCLGAFAFEPGIPYNGPDGRCANATLLMLARKRGHRWRAAFDPAAPESLQPAAQPPVYVPERRTVLRESLQPRLLAYKGALHLREYPA
jgi:hypothetical protein